MNNIINYIIVMNVINVIYNYLTVTHAIYKLINWHAKDV